MQTGSAHVRVDNHHPRTGLSHGDGHAHHGGALAFPWRAAGLVATPSETSETTPPCKQQAIAVLGSDWPEQPEQPGEGRTMKIINVVGARPNFMKVAPVHLAMCARGLDAKLIHTGQHYDDNMSRVFFEQLGMPRPDENLGVGSCSHAVQTARVMEAFEQVVLSHKPDLVMVAGDINSTVACALVAQKLHIKVAHLEAGLRSRDMRMAEEVNRILTDQISDLLLTPSADADDNLLREGIAADKIHRVGNAMIDSLLGHLDAARATGAVAAQGLVKGGYILTTIHRAENVDDPQTCERVLRILATASEDLPVLFPMHPRTQARIKAFGLQPVVDAARDLRVVDPIGYLDFLALQADAKVVLTDSGGIQEETTALGVPCLTLRDNTERPITVTQGTNTIVGTDRKRILAELATILKGGRTRGSVPELWDGHTAERVVDVVVAALGTTQDLDPFVVRA